MNYKLYYINKNLFYILFFVIINKINYFYFMYKKSNLSKIE